MDRRVFETELKSEGYDEIVNGRTQTVRPVEVFAMARGCLHAETFGPGGVVTLVGRKH